MSARRRIAWRRRSQSIGKAGADEDSFAGVLMLTALLVGFGAVLPQPVEFADYLLGDFPAAERKIPREPRPPVGSVVGDWRHRLDHSRLAYHALLELVQALEAVGATQ